MRLHNKWISLTAIAALFAVTLAGCGGSDSGGNGNDISLTPYITRATESSFSPSARILAARDAAASGATWLSADTATQYDADFATIRAGVPAVREIEARPEYDLRTIVVTVNPSASWVSNWQSGNKSTGEGALDDLLNEFAPEKVEAIGTPSAETAYFQLTFGQSLNMVKLAERLKTASTSIKSAQPNYTAGDGSNIRKVEGSTGGTRQYAFVQGWGDCAAGCINRHQWNISVSADGKTATLVSETGTPLITATP